MEAVAEGLFVVKDGEIRLIAGRRMADGAMRFPMPSGPEAERYQPVELACEGRLWSWTVQRFRPKSPPYAGADDEASFRPFAVGYVEFAGALIVEGRILTDAPERLAIGWPMRVAVERFATATRGEVATYAFTPVSQEDRTA